MKEIGGYIEFEYFHGYMLHGDGIKLDCGRSCLAYLIKAKGIDCLAMPSFMCDAVFDLCSEHNVKMDFYDVSYDLKPISPKVKEGAYLYLCNYYGQLNEQDIAAYRDRYRKVIVDNTQAYFAEPVTGVDTIYTCRKYFGVPDGGILYSSDVLHEEIEQAESFDQMLYLMGRFERTASEFYENSSFNNDRFKGQPVKRMSKLTENLLHGLDYEYIKQRREENFDFLHAAFKERNRLTLKKVPGPFAYPLLIDEASDAATIRKKLAIEKIYVPILWQNVVNAEQKKRTDYDLAMNILPIPCDQRYGIPEMGYLTEMIKSFL